MKRFHFTSADFRKIGKVLGVSPREYETYVRFEIERRDLQRKLILEIYPDIRIGRSTGNLVTVYTSNSHLQLQFCSGYVVSGVLNEVTFVGEKGDKVSGLIVEREAGCSLYANVDREMLSGDFTRLGPEVMLSGIALSLTEGILPRKRRKPVKRSR
jgi:hypothetical protein